MKCLVQQICVLGILTMAMSILLISGGVDLSVGNIMVLSGVVMYVVLNNGLPTAAAVVAGLVTGMACGLLNGIIISKSKCIPLVITLGTSKMFYGMALTVSGGRIMNFGGAFNGLKTKFFEVFSPMLLVLLAMVPVRRRMDGKPAIVFSGKAIGTTLLGIAGAIALGVGMCMTMIWNMMIPGIAVGIVGIVLLLCLIPVIKGLQ